MELKAYSPIVKTDSGKWTLFRYASENAPEAIESVPGLTVYGSAGSDLPVSIKSISSKSESSR